MSHTTDTRFTVFQQPRLLREARTIEAMVHIYCRQKHSGDDAVKSDVPHSVLREAALCTECSDLLEYALLRLEKCPFQEEKSTCANCKVHCYKPDRREDIRAVMRYAGPHMLYRHPYLAFMHLVIDSRHAAPDLPRRQAK